MSSADRNLLFGILALQNNLVTRDALLGAFNTWIADKTLDLGDLLRNRGNLSPNQLTLLNALTAELIKQLGSVEECLAQLSAVPSAQEALGELPDSDLQASMRHVSKHRAASEISQLHTLSGSSVGSSSQVGSRFRILRPHAHGGLGLVSVAHDGELNREVALKEIQSKYADDVGSRARFVLEAEITGGLEHPGIVPVYGLGQYADGRPFYAMRFVRGDSLKDALKDFHRKSRELTDSEHNLRLRRLLQRFIDVCEALYYAHSRGVLHRDLKPGNIMLGKYGETLVVDWGLARTAARTKPGERSTKLMDEEPSLHPRTESHDTLDGQAVGTPHYMSPEQAAGKLELLGPATDVYSLGATLYAILTGQPPVDGTDTTEALTNARLGRISPPRGVNPRTPRALEAICLRALALEPAKRYSSARALADDVEHWLADEPVEAYPEPLLARGRRLLRKQPMVTGSIMATLLVGLLAFAIGSVLLGQKNHQLSLANSELKLARNAAITERQKAETQAELAQRNALAASNNAERAEAEKQRTRKAMDLLVAVFRKPDPTQNGRDVKAADLLIPAANEAKSTLADAPQLQADLLSTIALTLGGLGLYQESIPLAEDALRLREQHLGNEHPDTLIAKNSLAAAYHEGGLVDKALPLFERMLQKAQSQLGPEHEEVLTLMNNLGLAYKSAGQIDRALPLLESALETATAKLGPNHLSTLTAMNSLASAYGDAGQHDKAIPLFESVLQKRQELLPLDHPHTLMTTSNLARVYDQAGQFEKSLRLHLETLDKSRAKLGSEHPNTLRAMSSLASAYYLSGDLEKALPIAQETYLKMQARLGPDHPSTLTALDDLAEIFSASGKGEQALTHWEECLRKRQVKLGLDHPATLQSLSRLAEGFRQAGHWDKAQPLLVDAVRIQQARYGNDSPGTLTAQERLLSFYLKSNQHGKAVLVWNEYLAARRKALAPESLDLAGMLALSALEFLETNAWDLAEESLREALQIREKLQPDDWSTFNSQTMLGGALVGRGQDLRKTDREQADKLLLEAEPLLLRGFQGMNERRDKIPPEGQPRLNEAVQRLIDYYTAQENADEVEKWQLKLAELKSGK